MGPNESRNLWISIGAGIFATFMLYSYSQEKKAELEKAAGDKVKVVVARDDIREMDNIYDNVLEIKEKLREEVEPDSFDSIAAIVGGVSAIPIKKGQTITKNMVLEQGPETGMAIMVSPSKRAITIPVSPERVNGGLIRPGDRVDILAVVDTGKGVNLKREVAVLMQNVVILATGPAILNNLPRTIERDPSGKSLVQTTLTGQTNYSTVTIEGNLQEAQDLIYLASTNSGSIYFLLRNPNDRKLADRTLASSAESISNKVSPQTGFSSQPAPNAGALPR